MDQKQIIARFERERVKRRLNHEEFADLIGVNRTTWMRMRTGKHKARMTTIRDIEEKLAQAAA